MKNGITRMVIALLNKANNPLRAWRLCQSTHKVKSDDLEHLDMPRQTGFRNKAPYYITLSVRNEHACVRDTFHTSCVTRLTSVPV